MGRLTCNVRANVGHLEKRSDRFPVNVHGLLLVAAGVDEDFQIPGATADSCTDTQIVVVHSYQTELYEGQEEPKSFDFIQVMLASPCFKPILQHFTPAN